MKKVVLLILLLLPISSALQFSPPALEFQLEKDEVRCKNIQYQVDYLTKAKDVWADNQYEQWAISKFQTNSEQHKIQVSYPAQLNPGTGEAEICIWGAKPGNYKGALVFQEKKIGNTIVQFAIWLKVNIEDNEPQEIEQDPVETKKSRRSSSSSGDSSGIIWTSSEKEQKPEEPQFNFPNDPIELKDKPTQKQNYQTPLIVLTITPIALLFILLLVLPRKQ